MKRGFDLVLSVALAILFALPMLLIAVMVKVTSAGPVLYWSDRVGVNNTIFRMPKFRTMRMDTPEVATHLLKDAERYVTPFGKFLRSTSLDELPQLFSIMRGDLSFVGPRPALFNQEDLVMLRTRRGIHTLIPGLTGWAQINGRDEIPIPMKVRLDEYYLKNRSLALDLRIVLLTILKVMRCEGIKH
jgi:O-antigen biosynthesis protein WbqP